MHSLTAYRQILEGKSPSNMHNTVPPKKRVCVAQRRLFARTKSLVDYVLAKDALTPCRPTFLVRLCAGGTVGCCRLGERELNIIPVLDVDIRPDHLGWNGSAVHTFSRKNKWSLYRAFSEHDPFAQGPFKLAAGLEPGWYVPGVNDYEDHVGVLGGGRRDPMSDLNIFFRVLRNKYPGHRVIVLASPPCRMISVCNQGEDEGDLEEYLGGTRRFLQRLRFSKDCGFFDHLLVECSAPGRYVRENHFVPGKAAQMMLDALGPGFSVKKLEAAKWGSASLRNRLLFAETSVFDYLPAQLDYDDYRGWGPVVGVCKSSNLRLVARTWRGAVFAGKLPTEPSTCLTTMGLDMYAERDDDPRPTCVTIDVLSLAKLLGCDPRDSRLPLLKRMPFRRASILIGIGFASQWYLAVLTGQLAAAMVPAQEGGLLSKDHASRVFWRIENWRRSRHPKPVPRVWPKIHKIKVRANHLRKKKQRRNKRKRKR